MFGPPAEGKATSEGVPSKPVEGAEFIMAFKAEASEGVSPAKAGFPPEAEGDEV